MEQREYIFEYTDQEGDEYSSEIYTSLADCRGEIRSLQLTEYIITRTFVYTKLDDLTSVYAGGFNY